MIRPSDTSSAQQWHSSDLLVRIARGEVAASPGDSHVGSDAVERGAASDAKFGTTTLGLIAGDPELYEQLSVRRSTAWEERTLVVFGARHRSLWALDALVGRVTKFGHDWSSLRDAILRTIDAPDEGSPILDAVSLDSLYAITEVLYEHELDPEAERGLLAFIASRVKAGRPIAKKHIGRLVERVLHAGFTGQARALLPFWTEPERARHAIMAELQHPRFGGSYDSMLAVVNEPYRRLGIGHLVLDAADGTGFARLRATVPTASASGLLVSVIMTCRNPGAEMLAAARSVVAQSYRDWELIIMDDGSSGEFDDILSDVAALDSRVRVVRGTGEAGDSVRRNEAIDMARGEFVALQDSFAWSHPRRLEIQVHDLMANPARLANTVHSARVTMDLSFLSRSGTRPAVADTSLLFRLAPVKSAIGYFDTARHGADREYRQRIATVTKSSVPALVQGAPLQFVVGEVADRGRVGSATELWADPEHLMYTSAVHGFHKRIDEGVQDAYVPFPLDKRPFHAPVRWRQKRPEGRRYDLLVVLDGRTLSTRTAFLRTVTEEIEEAVAAGLQVAVLQSDSLTGPRAISHQYPLDLQALIDSGEVERVGADEDVRADVAVIRHAGAAQGHRIEAWSPVVSRTVVVEDRSDGDARGKTISKADVTSIVAGWFGVEPTWTVALPELPAPVLTACSVVGGRLALTISTSTPRRVRGVRLDDGSDVVELDVAKASAHSIIATSPAGMAAGDWTVIVGFDIGADHRVEKMCPTSSTTLFWNAGEHIALAKTGGALRILPKVATSSLPAGRDFATTQLMPVVKQIEATDEFFEIVIEPITSAAISRIYAAREVEGGVVRIRDFAAATADGGRKVSRRTLAKFAGSKWQLFGSFQTPLGRVEYPLTLNGEVLIGGTSSLRPQILPDGHVKVVPPLPGKMVVAARRVARAVDGSIGERVRRGISALSGAIGDSGLAGDLSAPRVTAPPTVTVVMPVYNVEPYLEEAIASVLDQEYSDIELIIVDDASTDAGFEIIEKYWKRDPRVRVFSLDHNTLGGAGMPSNIGIRNARGTYVAFADSDDHVSKAALAKMVTLGSETSADLVIGDFRTFTDTLKEGSESYDRKVWENLPLGTVIDASSHPDLFRLSPVPWRKLYRREFLESNRILYPEGDYFYEDNPLHWFVLSRARAVVMCDDVVSFHRMEREGQTMGAATYKLGAFVSHANTIRNFLAQSGEAPGEMLIESFVGYLDRTHWAATKQSQPAVSALVRRGFGEVYRRALELAPTASIPPKTRVKLEADQAAYPDVDLTVVIPVFNSCDLIRETLDSVLAIRGVRINVLLVDDGSTDDSLAVAQEYEGRHPNVHVFSQGNRGAGRARNSVIPLCTGRYTFFLDADDTVDAKGLASAVRQADAESADLLFMKYRINFTDEGRSQGMFKADREVWESLPKARTNAERQRLSARLINYPWNRIIRTSLLHDANIFFGATVVHNDVQFHWHSIVSAQRISFIDAEVCSHRKFATRQQVTNVNDARRLVVLDALQATNERISVLEAFPVVEDEWGKFALHLVEWATSRVPDSHRAVYAKRSEALVSSFAKR